MSPISKINIEGYFGKIAKLAVTDRVTWEVVCYEQGGPSGSIPRFRGREKCHPTSLGRCARAESAASESRDSDHHTLHWDKTSAVRDRL